MTSSDF
nr:unnamed protein product [Callosobruchus analis]